MRAAPHRKAKAPPPMPWKRLGDEAFARGDFWQAASFYTHRVQERLAVERGLPCMCVVSDEVFPWRRNLCRAQCFRMSRRRGP